jgi:DNA-binding response OmpR family regulator
MKKRILYVEDDEDLGELTAQIMQRENYEVEYRTSLCNIRNIIKDFVPDLMVMDIEVGELSCLDEIDSIKKFFPDVPILFVSSHTDEKTVSESIEKGVGLFIKKPYGANELIHDIQLLLPKERRLTTFGEYQIDQVGVLYYQNRRLAILPSKEQQVILYLAEHIHQAVSRKELLNHIWNNEDAGDALNTCISHLRKYLSEENRPVLLSVGRKGYVLIK